MRKVYLIGAGPGDEGLLTIKGKEAITKCDIILYDRLINRNILKYAKYDCKLIYCGKKPNSHYKTQNEINDLLVQFAKDGNVVGRIKGGDPYVFGRGGEEALRLHDESIEFEVIPGIPSPIAALNYAGIPITHRELARSFHVFTATMEDDTSIDWNVVSKLEGTLIFMMGYRKLENIVSNLIDSGKDKKTPVAIIMNGTTSKERTTIGTLENIVCRASENNMQSPCIITVGKVIDLNEKLNWNKKVLKNKNICIARTKEQNKKTADKLIELGATVTEIRGIETEFIEESIAPYIEQIDSYNCISFNSVNGVKYFFDYLIERKYDLRQLTMDLATIGEKTKEAVEKRGLIPSIVADDFTAEGLVEKILEKNIGKKILNIKSEQGRTILSEKLKAEKHHVDNVNIYRTRKIKTQDNSLLDEVDIILYTSSSVVNSLIKSFGVEKLREKEAISIGPITGHELNKNSIKNITSSKCTIDSMIDKLIEVFE